VRLVMAWAWHHRPSHDSRIGQQPAHIQDFGQSGWCAFTPCGHEKSPQPARGLAACGTYRHTRRAWLPAPKTWGLVNVSSILPRLKKDLLKKTADSRQSTGAPEADWHACRRLIASCRCCRVATTRLGRSAPASPRSRASLTDERVAAGLLVGPSQR